LTLAARPLRLRQRTVATVLLAVTGLALAVGLLILDRIGETVIAARERAVAASARDYFVAFAHEEGLGPLSRALERHEREADGEAFRYALFSSQGALLGGAALLRWSQLPQPGLTRLVITSEGRTAPWEVLVQPISTGGKLVVYEDLAERRAFRGALEDGAILALVVALAAVYGASVWLNRILYRRAKTIEVTASQIASGRITARAPADPAGDVFDRLGSAINAMLDHNEDLMTGMRTVTDSLAHDLRSPLTRMKGALARAQDPTIDDGARMAAIGHALEEADRALETTSALLDIARAETGVSRDLFRPVDVMALAAETAELFGPVLEDAGQTLALVGGGAPMVVQGHELLLRQALGNLLHNAARHAGPGARVTLEVRRVGPRVEIIVGDSGPGIPPEHRGRVLQRFVRLDAARSVGGAGLGLAIAAACAKLHRGAVGLEDNHPGLRVVLDMEA